MKTGKIIIDVANPYQKREDKKFYIPVSFYKNSSRKKNSTLLQEVSLMYNPYFGAKHYDNHLDMKLDSTIRKFF